LFPYTTLFRSVDETRESLHLSHTDGRLEVGHPVVVPDHLVPVRTLRIHSVVAQQPEVLRQRGVVGHAHSTLTGGDDLVAVEREAADAAEGAHAPAAI